MSETAGFRLLFVGGGVGGQQLGPDKWFDPAMVGPEAAAEMHGHVINPDASWKFHRALPYLQQARQDKRLIVGTHIPQWDFDVAYFAGSTDHTAAALAAVAQLPYPPKWIILEPLAMDEDEETRLRSLMEERLDPATILVHEPYLLSS